MKMTLPRTGASGEQTFSDFVDFDEKYNENLGLNGKILKVCTDDMPSCSNSKHGYITFSLYGNGQFYKYRKACENFLHMNFTDCERADQLLDKMKKNAVHNTIFEIRDGNVVNINCDGNSCAEEERIFLPLDNKEKNKLKTADFKNFYTVVNNSKLFWCKVKSVIFKCSDCNQTYASHGHICNVVCKKIQFREFTKLFKKLIKIDVFYDIETFMHNNTFVPGLLSFSLNFSLSQTSYSRNSEISGVDNIILLELQNIVLNKIESISGLKKRKVLNSECYEILDENLDGSTDVMIKFVEVLECVTTECNSFTATDLNKRVSVISFNGSKFDDLFLFAAIVKKNKFCGCELKNLRILERGSKLICMSCQLFTKCPLTDKNLLTSFRTQDLRNFLLTGGLDSNAKSFGIECQKLCFPHVLIDALREKKVDRIMTEFPAYSYFEGFGGFLCSKEEYENLKSSFQGNYDILEIWSEYCSYDVVVLKQLYQKFMLSIADFFSPLLKGKIFDPTHKLTLPSLSNALCYLTMAQNFDSSKIFTPVGDYLNSVYKSVYGGHCQSNAIGDLPNPETKTFFDFNGEYSGLMMGLLPYGLIKKLNFHEISHLNRTINELFAQKNSNFSDLPPFVVKAHLKAPSDSRYHFCLPNVPDRDKKGSLIWTNASKTNYYFSVDLFTAIKFYKYEVTILDDDFNHVYESWQPLFKEYVLYCQKLKREGKTENNKTKENVGKLFGNALYGYQIKKPDQDETMIISNMDDFTSLRQLEIQGCMKITHVLSRDSIVDANTVLEKQKRSRVTYSHISHTDGVTFTSSEYSPFDDLGQPTLENYSFPMVIKCTKTNVFELETNTLPQNGIAVLASSRLLNAELYFSMLITEKELELPIEKREPIVFYTDTDSFMVERSRISQKWYSDTNVTYNFDTQKFEPWGKNEFKDKNNKDFIPVKILLAGKKLYCCIGPDNEIKCASKGVDSYSIVRESKKQDERNDSAIKEFVEKFQKIIDLQTVTFKQDSMKKDYSTYSISKECIERKLKLSDIPMIMYKEVDKCKYYRPLNDSDDLKKLNLDDNCDENSVDYVV